MSAQRISLSDMELALGAIAGLARGRDGALAGRTVAVITGEEALALESAHKIISVMARNEDEARQAVARWQSEARSRGQR